MGSCLSSNRPITKHQHKGRGGDGTTKNRRKGRGGDGTTGGTSGVIF